MGNQVAAQYEKEGIWKEPGNSVKGNSEARTLKSSEPLPDEMKGFKKLYWVCLGCFVLGILITPLFAIGALAFMVVYCVDVSIVNFKRSMLRLVKFKLHDGIDNDMMFETMQSVLISKYAMQIERTNGVMTVVHSGHMYDVLIEEDGTFRIWWRFGMAKAFVPKNKYKSYKTILADMGIIAYEIQNAFGITA